MGLTVTTAPSIEPVDLDEVKVHLRIDHDGEDALLNTFITAARREVERWCNRTLINTTLTYTLDSFPAIIKLPRPPLSSVTHVKYYDTAGSQQTWSSAEYDVVTSCEPGYIVPAWSYSWPAYRDQSETIEVQYVAGYGSARSDVPDTLRTAVLMLVSDMYEHRLSQSEMKLDQNETVKRLLWLERVHEFY